MPDLEAMRFLTLGATFGLPFGPAPSPFEVLTDFPLAGFFVGKGIVPVRFLRLAVEGHGAGSAFGAGVDIDHGIACLVSDLDGAFWSEEFAGGGKAHHSASSHSPAPILAPATWRAHVPPQVPFSKAGQ
jgi:hypothetical protein